VAASVKISSFSLLSINTFIFLFLILWG
jgi:hypothetical protein